MSLIPLPVRYATARSGETWPEATIAGLRAEPGGDLRLLPLPQVAPPSIQPVTPVGPSGLALDDACGLYVSDTTGDRVLRVALDCGAIVEVPVKAPAGLCWGPHDWVYVGSGEGSVLVFTTPELRLRDAWPGFQQPAYLACHRESVLVVDTGARTLQRFDWRGRAEATYVNAPSDPGAVAVGHGGTIYVADRGAGGIARLTWAGAGAGSPLAPDVQATAIAVRHGILYIADATTGSIVLIALPSGDRLGVVSGFTGPVSALAAGDEALYVKTGLDAMYLTAVYNAAFAPSGSLTMSALDAGRDSVWARAEARCVVPDRTSAELAWYTDDSDTPATITWQTAPCLDLLIPGRRYLWLRVTLSSRDGPASPTLLGVQAQTPGGSYLDHLPYVYSRDPDRSGLSKLVLDQADPADYEPGDLDYLRREYSRTPPEGNQVGRLLDLARSQLGDLEQAIDDLPRSFDPVTAPAFMLDWLASWLAFQVPPRLLDGTHPDDVRRLLLGLAALYRRRGTPRGVADFVEIYAQVRPHLFEDYRERPLWMVGDTPLGFGTGLPDREVEGMLVGEAVVGETGPEDPVQIGAALFASTAHRFQVVVPPKPGLDAAARSLITSVVEAERPAHTAFHICFAEPRMRIGIQARVGVDALVASAPGTLELDEAATLGVDTWLAAPAAAGGTVGGDGVIGIGTRLG